MKRALCFFFFFFFLLSAFSQTTCRCESGEKLKPQIFFYADRGLIDSAFLVYDDIKKMNGDACTILYHHGVSQLYMQKQEWSSARLSLTAAEKLIQKNKCDPAVVSKHYSITGLFYLNISKTDSSAWAYLKAAEAAEQSDNKYVQARAYGDVGFTMSQTGDFLKSIEYNKKSVAVAKSLSDPQGRQLLVIKSAHLAAAYMSIFENTGNLKYLDSCGAIASNALLLSKEAKDINGLMESYNILSRFYFIKKEFKQSNLYSDSMIAAHIPQFTNRFLSLAWLNKAAVARQNNDISNAALFADSSLKYAALFNPQLEIKSLEMVYAVNKELKNTDRSLQAYERMTLLKDSIFSLEKNKAITELEKKYNKEKDERTIHNLAQQKQIYLLLAVAGLLAAFTIAFFLRQQTLRHKQKIMEAEQRLNRARMNPHFFFNALTAMQRFALKENDGKALANNLSKFSHIMRETLESTYKEYVTVKQEVEFLKEYMEIQKIRFPELFSYALMVDGEMEPADVLIPSMIIQPFIENSIEHGFADIDRNGELRVDFKQNNQTITIEISDNGKGLSRPFQKADEHISRASQIVKDRIYLLNIKLKTKADFSIDNHPGGRGVLVKIHLPLLYVRDNRI